MLTLQFCWTQLLSLHFFPLTSCLPITQAGLKFTMLSPLLPDCLEYRMYCDWFLKFVWVCCLYRLYIHRCSYDLNANSKNIIWGNPKRSGPSQRDGNRKADIWSSLWILTFHTSLDATVVLTKITMRLWNYLTRFNQNTGKKLSSVFKLLFKGDFWHIYA